ncbi:hypothetical protein RN001_004606 [Aquatica leii]|uniref:Uncharacterized protein n=1 Tax=Aquatica leii TaxID=1421715 RepID=A0AAN7Q036_9COLE|nr:hypothetical protein RN001_004606 [Aquatica leii]
MCPGKKDYCSRNKIIKQKQYLCDTLQNLHRFDPDILANEDSESEIPQTIELIEKPGPSRQETSESEIGQAWEKAGRRKKRKNKKAANKINIDKETGKGEQSVRENPKERRASRALRDKESRESSEEREPGNDIEQERHNAKMDVEDMDPEEREVERLMENYRIVMSLVPNNSSTITVDDRRQIRAAMHEIKLRTMLMIGVAKELRHKAKTSEKKMTTASTAVNPKRTTPGSYSAAVKTGQTENTGRTEEIQKSQRQQHKVSVTAKETGMTPEQVATVLREKIDPTTHKLAVRNFVTTKKGVITPLSLAPYALVAEEDSLSCRKPYVEPSIALPHQIEVQELDVGLHIGKPLTDFMKAQLLETHWSLPLNYQLPFSEKKINTEKVQRDICGDLI